MNREAHLKALYATRADFCRIFKEEMQNLYLLSLLLTADSEKAEQCFVAGLDDCAEGNQVFREWARSWARRAVIKNALRLIVPEAPVGDAGRAGLLETRAAANCQAWPALQGEISAVLALQPFERFVFVISVLEGYSDQECALLLGCTRQILVTARARALQQMPQSVEVERLNQTRAAFKIDTQHSNRNSTVELAIPARLATPA
jgi:hypothetical protein